MICHSNIGTVQSRNGRSVRKRFALVILTGALATGLASAAPVTFWYSGKVNSIYNPSNALPADIQLDTPIAGRWMFDAATAGYITGFDGPSGSVSNFYCAPVSGYAVLAQIGPHTLTNTAVLPGWSGYLNIYNDYGNADELYLYAGSAGLVLDGTVVSNGAVRIELRDNSQTAFSSAQFPTNAPVLAAFPNRHMFSWELRTSSSALIYRIEAELTAISTNEQVLLNIRTPSPTTVQLAWPSAVSGLTLQSTTNLAAPNWQTVATPGTDLGMEHTVTVPTTTSDAKFYRLKK